ncbi:hypothetical protein ASPSYDRAFT_864365 [Aspergillus sydowii CBS 593.65]|uniref:Uncharacterized protein n=1 Tax=Aspergillus sydowii CBS 593.65 TaxID=1036612 RepID=A0A1L9TJ73_9EURO|nr:uncharacterized protein ASPSYDRAFT_864365 [Aspergillus sydowii CBS 593.65]OJJ59421.1 hypothetical protein ASPSYDRAFT_864365 [Aspergillus sydowii CBS 593.65]
MLDFLMSSATITYHFHFFCIILSTVDIPLAALGWNIFLIFLSLLFFPPWFISRRCRTEHDIPATGST